MTDETSGVGCAVLAAGGSTRLGRPKQLVTLEGVPLVRRVVLQAHASVCRRVAVVVGANAAVVKETVRDVDVQCLLNEGWREGIASSLRRAVLWAEEEGYEALVVLLADQPLLTAAHVTALVERYERTGALVASTYGAVRGAPALFPRARFGELQSLAGDRGAGRLLVTTEHLETIRWPAGEVDVDTEDDVRRLTESRGSRESASGLAGSPPDRH